MVNKILLKYFNKQFYNNNNNNNNNNFTLKLLLNFNY